MTTAMTSAALFDLTGRTALVTGASSGLGWRFAKVLAANGANVGIAARRTDRLAALKAEIEADGGRACAVALDVTDLSSIAPAFDAVEAAFGPVDILVSNAGVAVEAMLADMTAEQWRKVLDTDLDGVFFTGQEAIRRMSRSGGGSIINIASAIAFHVSKTLGAYAVAKAGVVQLTKAMALETASAGIRVNAICPGYIETEINRDFFATEAGRTMIQRHVPMKRLGDIGDLDGTLLLLASKAGSFITGASIVVDGGLVL
ncbi:3-oxoacyl-[acyl-carrier protein] reductase [Tepidamorphus gemmatus]|jgi:3-oxoacyl-[acyl-carrier protein] reductase|uniref:3-oxoacyl-[acyl-carrier protein] reductase n=1 Tax=Tepidamorphus gemmatus TaxID=747076 RepID=A0A4R3MIR6_9HYPH|nr:SDR family oxidoreductase [Tepidamorphus gemmatus]TCT13244.1 3-oxoacyl-[acyl-carrier protein] reductase [Tepidamorphus gemmatus]